MNKLILFFSFIIISLFAQATTHVVDSLNNAGFGSFRAAVDSALIGDTIRFSPNLIANGSDSIVLTSKVTLNFKDSIVIVGLYNETDTLYLSGGGNSQILMLVGSNHSVLDSLVFINGYNWGVSLMDKRGGAIYVLNSDTLFLRNCFFRNCSAEYGGAIHAFSVALDVHNSFFISNYGRAGGAVMTNRDISLQVNTSYLNVSNSDFLNNESLVGGAIYVLEDSYLVVVDRCLFENNTGSNGAAMILSTYFLNTTPGQGTLILSNSILKNNRASFGGGIKIGGKDVNLQMDNTSFIKNGKLSFTSAGGGILVGATNSSIVDVFNSTFTQNKADSGASAIWVRGSGLINLATSVINIVNSTFTDNYIINGATIGASAVNSSVINVRSSIVALNVDYTSFSNNHLPSISSSGYNIFSTPIDTGTVLTAVSDQLNPTMSTLQLGSLGYNGGFAPTMMPLNGSIAINNGNPLDVSDAQNVAIVGIRDVGAAEVCSRTFKVDTIVAYDSYTWINGVTYTSNDSLAIDTIVNTSGCDSVVSLNLTILTSCRKTDTISACNGYTWRNGVTYDFSNYSAEHIIQDTTRCDSIYRLHLTITHSRIEFHQACESFTWRNGVTYTQDNTTAKDTVMVSAGCDSIFKLHLIIRNTEYSTEVRAACDSLTWMNGITYYTSTHIATDTLTNRYGCDSIVTLDLTINNPVNTIDSVSACLFYQWINGQVYLTDNNTATQTFTGSNGCDSNVTLNLEIHSGTLGTDTHVVCDSLVWINGNTYYTNTTTAIYNMVGGNSHGCDSIVTLNLTVNGTHDIDVISSCGPITWLDGNTYSSSTNTPTYTTINALGCDSVVTLSLTINTTSFGTETVTACTSYLWNGIIYTANNNTALDTVVNAAGCDSIITLNLTILNTTAGMDIISSCNPITWIDGNTYSSNNSTATHTISNSQGCDSVITLDFTLLQAITATDVINACSAITWLDGMVYAQSIIGPAVTLTNVNGCDSVVTLDFTLLEVDTSVIRSYLTLTAQATNATYHWIDCDNGRMAGETQASFTAIQNGNYQVEVTQNGCIDTSACLAITNVGIMETALIGVSIHPNPTSDVIHMDKGTNTSLEITITNSTGAIVYTATTQNQITTIDMAKMAAGIYWVTMKNELGMKVERVVKR